MMRILLSYYEAHFSPTREHFSPTRGHFSPNRGHFSPTRGHLRPPGGEKFFIAQMFKKYSFFRTFFHLVFAIFLLEKIETKKKISIEINFFPKYVD